MHALKRAFKAASGAIAELGGRFSSMTIAVGPAVVTLTKPADPATPAAAQEPPRVCMWCERTITSPQAPCFGRRGSVACEPSPRYGTVGGRPRRA